MIKSALKRGETRNYAIDALRFIAVCFVVYIHIFEINKGVVFADSFSWKLIDVLFAISRLAVPVFFAISGWFIFSRNRGEQIKKLQKQLPKLIKIFIAAVIGVNLILILFNLLGIYHVFPIGTDIKALWEMFILGKSPTIGTLWFLVSLIIVEAMFLFVSMKFKKDTWLIALAVLFFGLNLAYGAYRSVSGFAELPFPINETWFVGFAWFSLGYFLAKYFKDTPERLPTKTLVWLTVGASVFYLYEYLLHTSGAPFHFGPYNYHAIFIFTPLVAAGILLLAARSKRDDKVTRTLAYLGKNYALGIFIIHLLVMQPVNVFFLKSGLLIDYPVLKLIATYSSVVLVSLGLTAAYYKLKPVVLGSISKIPLRKS